MDASARLIKETWQREARNAGCTVKQSRGVQEANAAIDQKTEDEHWYSEKAQMKSMSFVSASIWVSDFLQPGPKLTAGSLIARRPYKTRSFKMLGLLNI